MYHPMMQGNAPLLLAIRQRNMSWAILELEQSIFKDILSSGPH